LIIWKIKRTESR